MNDILIGTSGYDYPEWKGVFYPRDLKRSDFLRFYAVQRVFGHYLSLWACKTIYKFY